MALPALRRIVTAHDPDGNAIIASNGPLATVADIAAIPGTIFHEVWSTGAAPALVDNGPDPTLGPVLLAPPPRGTRIRFVDIPPDTEAFLTAGAARMKDAFASIGDADASTVRAASPHPLMHRTQSVDYGVVMQGSLTLVLDSEEIELKVGDVVVQRGTNHAWANRSGAMCRMMFVLVDGVFAPELLSVLAGK